MQNQHSVWQFATAGNIHFGRGSSSLLSVELQRLKVERPLIVTDATIANLRPISDLLDTLRATSKGCTLFDECVVEPPVTVVEAAIAAGRGANVDSVIGIGGGSNIDIAKMAAVVLKHGGSPVDYFGFDAVPGPIMPLIAIPTTAGTGSEVSHSSVLTDVKNHVKVSSLSRWLRPSLALIDPVLTDTCPKTVTAHSGIDALVHAIEAYTNRSYVEMTTSDPASRAYSGSYPLTKLLAGEAMRLIGRYLVRAYQQPNDTEARDGMALAAMLGGMAFSNSGVALVHALEYPIGVLTHCSHGEGNGLLLPHVMRFNLPACSQSMADVAGYLGCDTTRLSIEAAANAAIDYVVELQRALGIRTKLSELGLQQNQIALVAQRAFPIKRLMEINPRKPTESDLVDIVTNAF